MSNKQAAIDFLQCWKRLDLEAALSRISDDAAFKPDCKNPAVVGRDSIRDVWALYMGAIKSYEYEIKAIAEQDNVVFLERDEILTLADRELFLPITAVFEFNDAGKVTAWRDYWDTSMANL